VAVEERIGQEKESNTEQNKGNLEINRAAEQTENLHEKVAVKDEDCIHLDIKLCI
jgi:hypothetical protein